MRIRREEELPVYERLGDVRARAVTLGKIADILQARGQLDEALRIYREEALPVFERLGEEPSRFQVLHRLGMITLKLDKHEEARHYLTEAAASCARIGNKAMQDRIQALLEKLDTPKPS